MPHSGLRGSTRRHAVVTPDLKRWIWTIASTGFAMPLARKRNARMQIALDGNKSCWERRWLDSERNAIVEAEDWRGPDFKTCANHDEAARSEA
jgi:hypothetical protein